MAKKKNIYMPLAYDIKGLSEASGRGRSVIYEDIAAGRLIARKAGGKNIILYNDAVAWLETLPIREPSSKSAGS